MPVPVTQQPSCKLFLPFFLIIQKKSGHITFAKTKNSCNTNFFKRTPKIGSNFTENFTPKIGNKRKFSENLTPKRKILAVVLKDGSHKKGKIRKIGKGIILE